VDEVGRGSDEDTEGEWVLEQIYGDLGSHCPARSRVDAVMGGGGADDVVNTATAEWGSYRHRDGASCLLGQSATQAQAVWPSGRRTGSITETLKPHKF
jgi:hypothetical protein